MGTTPDVLVIGGGIIGLTSAYFLAKEGLSVEVLDKGELGREASWAGAGIIPPGNPERATSPYDRLRAYSSAKWAGLTAELRERTGIDNGFLVCGGIEFLDDDDLDCMDLWTAEGLAFTPLDQNDLRRLEPNVRPPDLAAFHVPGCGQVRNPWHLRALIGGCERLGVTLRPHTSYPAGRRFDPGRKYVIAAGAWTDETLGLRLGVHPVRGQIVLFRAAEPPVKRVLLAGKRYLVPRPDGRVLAGSTEEPEAGFETANTPEGVRVLTEFACQLVPTLRSAAVEKTWAGLRPGSPDGLPFIGPVPGHDNVFVAAGHFRAGVQLSVGTAEIVRDLILGGPSAIPIDAFRLDRVPDRTGRPAFRS
jgi:glycine oxidase